MILLSGWAKKAKEAVMMKKKMIMLVAGILILISKSIYLILKYPRHDKSITG